MIPPVDNKANGGYAKPRASGDDPEGQFIDAQADW